MVEETTPGGNANINGSKFETIVYKILDYRIRKNYQLSEVIENDKGILEYCNLLKDDKIYCTYSSQQKFNTEFLKRRNLDPYKIHHRKDPDGFFYYHESNTATLLEIKSQNSNGSVSEKPGAGPYFIFQYKKILEDLNCDVKMFWCLDEFFNTPEFEDCTKEWMNLYDMGYYFGVDFPLEMIGLEEPIKTTKEEIDNIINECDKEFKIRMEEKELTNKKKKQEIDKDKGAIPLF